MDVRSVYEKLFAALEREVGAFDPETLSAVIGFDAGGPLSFRTLSERRDGFTTYVSCELAVRDEQKPSELGRYELLATSDDEDWVRSVLTDIGNMSLEVAFGPGHTLDIGPWVEPDDVLQGVVFEEVCRVRVGLRPFGVLRVIGVTRPELELAMDRGTTALLDRLRADGIHPRTTATRPLSPSSDRRGRRA